MLVKLLSSDIADFWPAIKHSIDKSLPPTTYQSPIREANIRRALMAGDMTAWMIYREGESAMQMVGVMIVQTVHDPASEVRSLEIYSLAAIGERSIPAEAYEDGMKALKEEASERGCARICFYTRTESVVEQAKKMGFEPEYQFLTYIVPAGGQ